MFTTDLEEALQDDNLELLGLEHPITIQLMRELLSDEANGRALAGRLPDLPGSALLTVWKIDTQGKDGQSNRYVVRVGLSEEGDGIPWIEHLGERLLAISVFSSKTPLGWQALATSKKVRLLELLYRELSYSGIIDEETSYSAIPLAFFGIEKT